ncbi:MAG: GDP-mannose 4,6-dehydratase [Bacteroidales bacterium]|nr:GDP-mannose 4,6-dehydratase [Bacteroidales bacterium]
MNKTIEILENKLGKQAKIEYHPRHPAEMLTSRADTSKAEKMLNWRPRVTLEEGVQHMVDWYVENREFASSINTD